MRSYYLSILLRTKVRKNLISVGQLCFDKQAVFSQIESGFVYGQTKEVIGRGRRHGRLVFIGDYIY